MYKVCGCTLLLMIRLSVRGVEQRVLLGLSDTLTSQKILESRHYSEMEYWNN